MPPKAKAQAPGKKAEQKKKEKIIEDKTFGLKNKKGAKQQKFIQQVEKQIKSGGVPPRKRPEDKKDAKTKEKDDFGLLVRPVQKFEKGADPKSILCAYFKEGQCTKGAKCKFSHDLAIEKKSVKKNLYVDSRRVEDEPTEKKSLEAIEQITSKKSNRVLSDIVCKYFLDAVERGNYGWFWKCSNGDECIYRHALPEGFVLKKDKKNEKKDTLSLEDLIEKERAALASKQFTKITLETFLAWKQKKLLEKKDLAQKEEDKKKMDYKAGRSHGLSGREMFSFNPELASGDQIDEGEETFTSEQRDEDEIDYKEIELEKLGIDESDVHSESITQAPNDRLSHHIDNLIAFKPSVEVEDGASAVAINENLFMDDELEGLDDELDSLLNLDDEK